VSGLTVARFPALAEPTTLGPRRLPNRLVHAPMSVGYADERGHATRALREHYGRRAQGGVGMVITENVAVSPAGRQMTRQPMLTDEAAVAGFALVADEIKRHGAVAVMQIVHAGRYAGPWERYEEQRRLAPSPVAFPLPPDRTVTPQQITEQEIERSIAAFANTTALAREAGFDGVEIHGGQGFLIASFQSPRMNRRADRWGGSFENRCRFAWRVVDAVVAAAGADMIVGFHVMGDELMDGGWTAEDALEFSRGLGARGIHFVMPVCATFESLRAPHNVGLFDRPMFQHEVARRLAAELEIPVITNGGFADPRDGERVLAAGEAALVGLARPLFADPDWMRKVQAGAAETVRRCACNPPECLHTQLAGSVCTCWPEPVRGAGFLGYGA